MFYFMSFGIVAAVISASQVRSDPRVCAAHETIVARLAEHFGETQRKVGTTNSHLTVEIFVSPDTGSWTIIETAKGGLTCLVAAGQALQFQQEIVMRYRANFEQSI